MKLWSIGAIALAVFIVFISLLGMLAINSAIMPEFNSIPDLIEYPIAGLHLITLCGLIGLVCAIAIAAIFFVFYMLPICIGNILLDYYQKFNLKRKTK